VKLIKVWKPFRHDVPQILLLSSEKISQTRCATDSPTFLWEDFSDTMCHRFSYFPLRRFLRHDVPPNIPYSPMIDQNIFYYSSLMRELNSAVSSSHTTRRDRVQYRITWLDNTAGQTMQLWMTPISILKVYRTAYLSWTRCWDSPRLSRKPCGICWGLFNPQAIVEHVINRTEWILTHCRAPLAITEKNNSNTMRTD
jgi:hypothetical protein